MRHRRLVLARCPGWNMVHRRPWNANSGGNWGIYYLGNDGAPAAYAPLTEQGLKFLFFSPNQATTWSIQKLDFDNDYKRLDVMQSIHDSSNPDLSLFKAAVAKCLYITGSMTFRSCRTGSLDSTRKLRV
jgi:hypothetical protein